MIDSLFVMNLLDDLVKSSSNDSCLSIVCIVFYKHVCVFFNCPFMYFKISNVIFLILPEHIFKIVEKLI